MWPLLLLSVDCHFDPVHLRLWWKAVWAIAISWRQRLVSLTALAAAQNSAMAWLALGEAVIRAVAANLRPSSRHRAHDFGDTSIRLRACIFCCSPVRGIPAKLAIWRTGRPSISLFSLEFAHSNRSLD